MKKIMILLVAALLTVSFSACSKTDEATEDPDEIAGTVWEVESDNAVVTLSFGKDKTCIITTGSIAICTAYRKNYSFNPEDGINRLIFSEKSTEGKEVDTYYGIFIDRSLLRLTRANDNEVVADLKKLR